jgi:hypothetical protein
VANAANATVNYGLGAAAGDHPGEFTAPYGSDVQQLALFCVVMAHHVAADLITHWYGDASTTTVRFNQSAGPVFSKVLRFYALFQFMALASHLTLNPRMMDTGWNPTIAVQVWVPQPSPIAPQRDRLTHGGVDAQSSAFCMTLYRKRLIRGKTHAFWYSLCLVISLFHIVRLCEDGASRAARLCTKFSSSFLVGDSDGAEHNWGNA